MKQTRIMWDMPITIELEGKQSAPGIDAVFTYFAKIDSIFNPYNRQSELWQINHGSNTAHSREMKTVLNLCKQTSQQTQKYFVYKKNGQLDPLGLVKGWAVRQAARLLQDRGHKNFYIDAGGDIELAGSSRRGAGWKVGIRHPFVRGQIIKVLSLSDCGVATSGTYIRGEHIHRPSAGESELVSFTVVGPNVYEADRMATAAFAMGKKGIDFIAGLKNFEAYIVDCSGNACFTAGLEAFF